PELGRKRASDVQALRAVFTALAKPDAVLRSGTDEFDVAVDELVATLGRHRSRLDGEPVVRGRVRLTLPTDALDPWLVELELVDELDPGRWCTADDVWSAVPSAIDIAGGDEHLEILRRAVLELADSVGRRVPMLADLATMHEPASIELDLDAADDFIEV